MKRSSALLFLAGLLCACAAKQDTPTAAPSCTEEAKVCPDGSTVGRTGPACEFAACPGDAEPEPDAVMCTQDARECPDGSYVGRTGPDCEFAACPGGGEPMEPASATEPS
ncbi:MAG: hypothetical protein AAGA54_31670 [Myxococcota bacterium]